ncbi:MAG: hypothetical protein JRI23_13600 [Deltaproteobacteria bacterium]|nr:hypothetical protein [Deltaproteobacteria bacterium]MBW2532763.1 hypothetical protein [Deltaproteobacteria bacterium]
MHRPTRKLNNLIAKTDRKATRSRRPGKKVKRWKKQIEQFRPIADGAAPADGGAQ